MDAFGKNFSETDLEKAKKMAKSDTAAQLLAILAQSNDPAVGQALDALRAGDLRKAPILLQQLMASPQTRELVQKLMENANG